MIDKKIFYCWFGKGEMSDLNKKCIESWKKYCPDYEIIEINEDNFDVNITPYSAEAYEHGNWSYVSNAARLYTLKNNSGFYLDTDIQLVKSLDELRIYDKGFMTEFDSGQPDSGILGCGSEGSKFYNEVFDRLLPGTVLHKEFIQVMFRDYDVHGEPLTVYDDGFAILGEEYVPSIRTDVFTENTIGVHFFENTWAKQWKNVTDGFYPFPRIVAHKGFKLIHEDENPEVEVKIKSIKNSWMDQTVIYKMGYFFNPKVVKLVSGVFEAERIDYDRTAKTNTTITPSGLIVIWIDKENKDD